MTVKIVRWVIIRISLIFFASIFTSIIYFYFIIPPFDLILDGRQEGSVTFLDKNGEVFAWRGQQFDSLLRSENASSYLINAVVSTEDKNFYRHFGFSPRGILGAIIINIREGRGPFEGHGGSTITQQVAKLLCLMKTNKLDSGCRQQSLARKILEVLFAVALEIKFSKSEILSIYMNRVYLGASTTGFEAASNRYFSKSAKEVSLAESAMLAALLKAPSKYAPTNNLKLAQQRAKFVIEAMVQENYISSLEATIAINQPAILSNRAKQVIGVHFVDWIMRDAPNSLTVKTTEDIVIQTTFDPVIQKTVEEAVADVFASSVSPSSKSEAAVVVMSATGDVLAMLGSRKNRKVWGWYNRAFQAYRQPGSAFKPFVYAAALQQGYSPDYLLSDTKAPPPKLAHLRYWPKNYNHDYMGNITMKTGLTNSVNTVTVQLAHLVGIQNIIDLANRLGIQSKLSPNLSLALGSSEVSLLNLTAGYAGFLNLGRQIYPRGWTELRLKTSNDVIIQSFKNEGDKVLGDDVSKALIKMLVDAVEVGTGKTAIIDGWQVAGKTGTSQDARDAWFIGFTSKYVVGVWIGSDDNTPLKGVVGGNLPSKIWSKVMQNIHSQIPSRLPTLSTDQYKRLRNAIQKNGSNSLDSQQDSSEKDNFIRRFFDYMQNITK